jgi:hypothetical protein
MAAEEKLDLFRQNKAEYVASKMPTLITAQKAQYLAITGAGQPGGEEFQTKIGALYGMAFTIKMTWKFAGKGDYAVSKLEGQYWWDPPRKDQLFEGPAEELSWRLLIRTPDYIKQGDLTEAAGKLLDKKGIDEAREVRLVALTEGECVQMLHVGPYDEERRTVESMVEFAAAKGLEVHGRHHEIYLSDPRRVAPDKLRTILRLPVRKR